MKKNITQERHKKSFSDAHERSSLPAGALTWFPFSLRVTSGFTLSFLGEFPGEVVGSTFGKHFASVLEKSTKEENHENKFSSASFLLMTSVQIMFLLIPLKSHPLSACNSSPVHSATRQSPLRSKPHIQNKIFMFRRFPIFMIFWLFLENLFLLSFGADFFVHAV